MVVEYVIAGLIATFLLFVMLRGSSVKKIFGVSWYVIFIGGDIGGRKPHRINKSIVNGCPDAVFFDWVCLRYIVGEYKSRTSSYKPTGRELNQVQLYLGIMNKWNLAKPVGVLAYGSGKITKVIFNKKEFNKMYKKRFELLKVINSL